MDGGQHRVADQFFVEGQNGGQLISTPVELDSEKLDVWHAVHQRVQRAVTALFDNLDRFRTLATHFLTPSTVKAPVALATGRSSSSSSATARTKATDRVM